MRNSVSYKSRLLFLLGFSICSTVQAGVEVKLIESETFTDMDFANYSKKRAAEVTQKNLEEQFDRLAKPHLQGKNLIIEVTNLDLAGYLDYSYGHSNQPLRVVKDLAPFKLSFNYQLKSSTGEIIKQGSENLKNFVDLNRMRMKHTLEQQDFEYFTESIEIWIEQLLSQ